MVTYKKNELYQEMELFNNDGVKIGEAEVDIKNRMLSRFVIYEPYQNQGYGTEYVTALCKDFGITSLWVNADNSHAIHVYEKCGANTGKQGKACWGVSFDAGGKSGVDLFI